MSLETLDSLVIILRTQLEAQLTRQDLTWLSLKDPPVNPDDEDGRLYFAPLDLAKTIIKPYLLRLFRAISNDTFLVDDLDIAHHQTEAFRILAILICIKYPNHLLTRYRINIVRNYSSEFAINDKQLPIDEQKAQQIFGEWDRAFYLKQWDFCPEILEENKVVDCTGRIDGLRLPFLGHSKKLGDGSSGDVVEVKVPVGHFKFSDGSRGTNRQVEAFACKVFKSSDSNPYEKEFRILEFIRESPRSNPNVMLARGSLLVQTTCILYFEVADGSLHDHLVGLKEYDIPRSSEEIQAFLWRFHDILDALAFLHDDLVKSVNPSEEYRFAHLDLRPANILVFKRSERYPQEIWKIHDFGISKVKKTEKADEAKGWQKLFLSEPQGMSASGTLRARGSTTFLAPEYRDFKLDGMANVTSSADIWSFGCIMAVGLSFLLDGPQSVQEFASKRRARAGAEDVFFVSEERMRFSMGMPGIKLNSAVSDYLADVQKYIDSETDVYLKPVFRSIIALLKTAILAPIPKGRVKAKEGAKRLHNILLNLDPGEGGRGKLKTKKTLFGFMGKTPDSAEDPTQASVTFELALPEGSNLCKFSYCGRYLAFFSATSIAFCETNLIFRGGYKPAEGGKGVRLSKPVKGRWRGFEINSKYLVAFTNETYFDCYIFPHSVQDHLIPAFDRERLCYHFLNYACHSIHYISLSLKGDRELLVTVLQSEDLTYHVYLSDIAEMITAPTNSIYLTPSHRTHRPSTSTSRSESREKSSQTASSTSLDVQTREPLTWENSLLHSTESGQQSELTHIHSMQFSADSSIFTILSQPPKTNNLIWYCWDTTTTRRSRRRIGKLKRDLEAKTDAHQKWMTAFIPLIPEPSVLFITQRDTIRRRAFRNEDTKVEWSTMRLRTPILHVLPFAENDDHFIFIGLESGAVKALYAPNPNNQLYDKTEKIHFDFVLDLQCQDWVLGRDAAAYIEDGMEFLIARPPVKGKAGFVRKVYRPRAPRPAKHK